MKAPQSTSTRTHTAARTGKIARLPYNIREQINRRLQNGETGTAILKWLNGRPEVRAILKALFASRPLTPDNLSQWRKGGYRDWLAIQNSLSVVRDLEAQQARSRRDIAGPLASTLSHWAAVQYASCAQALVADEDSAERKWDRLREFCADISRFRRSTAFAERAELDREKLALKRSGASHLEE